MKATRRTFLISSVGLASALAVSRTAFADAPKVSETDPTAAALGYKMDGTTVDKTKFPRYAAGEACGNCSLFQGKPGDAFGGCMMFSGKQVSSKGWCNAYNKKA